MAPKRYPGPYPWNLQILAYLEKETLQMRFSEGC